jgi:uncharacterized Zn-binding protein involved in type VI secretion
MPGLCRITDLCTGHDFFAPRSPVVGSPDVLCNGVSVVRVGDPWQIHVRTVLPFDFHGASGLIGSSTVLCNGLGLMREGDFLDCESRVLTSSPDVICGG